MYAILDLTQRYSGRRRVGVPKMDYSGGLVHVQCHAIDCINNDKSFFDKDQSGLCSCDDKIVDGNARCVTYKRDYYFLLHYKLSGKDGWVKTK